jgi:peptide subunit release factor 1 (eRF1)
VYDDEGNLLEEKVKDANDVEKRKTMTVVQNKIENLIQRASSSKEAMDFLLSSVRNIDDSLGHIVPSTTTTEKVICSGLKLPSVTVSELLQMCHC